MGGYLLQCEILPVFAQVVIPKPRLGSTPGEFHLEIIRENVIC